LKEQKAKRKEKEHKRGGQNFNSLKNKTQLCISKMTYPTIAERNVTKRMFILSINQTNC
jgi:hypothetical protein